MSGEVKVGRPSFARICMHVARDLAMRSTCSRLQVGCFEVSPDYRRQIGWGYNGGASGQENDCLSSAAGLCGHVHAEVNMICNASMVSRTDLKFIFVTDLPCRACAVTLVNWGGVVRVVYDRDYRIREGIEVLEVAGIQVEKYDGGRTR
jgi:dCMP deaminase